MMWEIIINIRRRIIITINIVIILLIFWKDKQAKAYVTYLTTATWKVLDMLLVKTINPITTTTYKIWSERLLRYVPSNYIDSVVVRQKCTCIVLYNAYGTWDQSMWFLNYLALRYHVILRLNNWVFLLRTLTILRHGILRLNTWYLKAK
jgi:hypothetical protein